VSYFFAGAVAGAGCIAVFCSAVNTESVMAFTVAGWISARVVR